MLHAQAIIINKHILSALKFPYPIAVAMLGMAGTTVTSILYVRVFKMVASPQHVSILFRGGGGGRSSVQAPFIVWQ
jgi:hypothetical protein